MDNDETDKFIAELMRPYSSAFSQFQMAMLKIAKAQGMQINPNRLGEYFKPLAAPTPPTNGNDDDERKVIAFATRQPLKR